MLHYLWCGDQQRESIMKDSTTDPPTTDPPTTDPTTTTTTTTTTPNPKSPTLRRRALVCCVNLLQRFLNGVICFVLIFIATILVVNVTSPFGVWEQYWEENLWSVIFPPATIDALSSNNHIAASLMFDGGSSRSSSPDDEIAAAAIATSPLPLPPTVSVQWRTPVGCDYSGFFVETLTFAVGLSSLLPKFHLDIGKCKETMLSTMTKRERDFLLTRRTPLHAKGGGGGGGASDIMILHKLPGQQYHLPEHGNHLVIGRHMTESTVLSLVEAKEAMRVDEVWVPTEFHRKVFLNAGVASQRVYVVPEPVDVDFYHPTMETETETETDSKQTKFVSVFKWEERKGWDVLLQAYWSTFTADDDVELVLRTYKPSWSPGTKNIQVLVAQHATKLYGGGSDSSNLAKVTVLSNDLSKMELRQLYQDSDAFVLPTRGEGWCLPCVEAMAMSLPILVTNFSGPTSYLTKERGFPLKYKLDERTGYAEPSVSSLAAAMRSIYVNPVDAKERGKRGREYVMRHLSTDVVANMVVERLSLLWSRRKTTGGVVVVEEERVEL